MNQKIKNYMGGAVVLVLLSVTFSVWSAARSYSRSIQPSSFRSFSVTGEGEVVAVPDVAQFTFQIITQGGVNLAATQEDATKKTNKAIAFLKDAGVDEKDIKTQSYNVEPRYQRFNCNRPYVSNLLLAPEPTPCPPPEIIGYTVRQTVSVKVRDFEKIGPILTNLVENGANSVSGLNFTIDDPTALQNEAREAAIKKAKEKARSVARAGGFSVGRLLGIEEGFQGYPKYDYRTLAFAEDAGLAGVPAAAPTIEPGSQDVKVNVTLRYEIR